MQHRAAALADRCGPARQAARALAASHAVVLLEEVEDGVCRVERPPPVGRRAGTRTRQTLLCQAGRRRWQHAGLEQRADAVSVCARAGAPVRLGDDAHARMQHGRVGHGGDGQRGRRQQLDDRRHVAVDMEC
eukprot:scaffold6511_cov112-Isochrysis_galbana.AAC.2